MAHSYVECFPSETEAFEAFTRSYPDGSTLLIDTYDTVEGARRAAAVAVELAASGGRLGAVRLDSGDLLELSGRVREVLDGAGLPGVTIFASGNLDEHEIARLLVSGAPIDGFGVGSRLAVSDGAPSIDLVYKLVDFDGRPVLKLSADKATLPGREAGLAPDRGRPLRRRPDRPRGRRAAAWGAGHCWSARPPGATRSPRARARLLHREPRFPKRTDSSTRRRIPSRSAQRSMRSATPQSRSSTGGNRRDKPARLDVRADLDLPLARAIPGGQLRIDRHDTEHWPLE